MKTIKDQVIQKLSEFQKLCRCNIPEMSPEMRDRLRIQLGAEAEAQAIIENDYTFFQFNPVKANLTALGIEVEMIKSLGDQIRVGIYV